MASPPALVAALAAAIIVLTVPATAAAANECQISYTYTAGSGPSAVPQVQQRQVSANAIVIINQGAMRYVVNDRDWPVEVEVTTLDGGSTWVLLGWKGARDPAGVNYVGSILLKKAKCLPGGTAAPGPVADTEAAIVAELAAVVDAVAAMIDEQHATRHEIIKAKVRDVVGSMRDIGATGADRLAAWRAQARAVQGKSAAAFADCPSTAAQTAYDELRIQRILAAHSRDRQGAATAAAIDDAIASLARLECVPLRGGRAVRLVSYR